MCALGPDAILVRFPMLRSKQAEHSALGPISDVVSLRDRINERIFVIESDRPASSSAGDANWENILSIETCQGRLLRRFLRYLITGHGMQPLIFQQRRARNEALS